MPERKAINDSVSAPISLDEGAQRKGLLLPDAMAFRTALPLQVLLFVSGARGRLYPVVEIREALGRSFNLLGMRRARTTPNDVDRP